MDVSSLYTNTPQEEGIEIVCKAYETFLTHYLREMLGLILTENPFEFNEKKLSPNPWCRNGKKNSCVFCKYIHGGDRDKINSTKLKWNVSLNWLAHSTLQ